VQAGTIILSLGGQKLDERTPLLRALARHQVGERVPIGIWQDGATRTIEITLEELPR
jgi:S1-C subfamily serine protease